jgi:hypothetical protein
MSRPRKARVEGASTVAHEAHWDATQLATIVADFKAAHPDLWEELRLCPLQHGLDTMIEKLNA